MKKIWKNLLYACLTIFSFNIILAFEISTGIGVAKQVGPAWELFSLPKNMHWDLKNGNYDFFIKTKIMFPINEKIQIGLGGNIIKCNPRIYQKSFKSLDYIENSTLNYIKNTFKSTNITSSLVNELCYKASCFSFELEPTISIYFLDLYCGLCLDSHKQNIDCKFTQDTQITNVKEKLITGKVGLELKHDFQINNIFSIYVGLGYELRNLFTFSDIKKLKVDSLPLKHFIKANIGGAFTF